jgi:hypothetical protein
MRYAKKNNLSVSNIRHTKGSFDVTIASLKSKEKITKELEERLKENFSEKFKSDYLGNTLKLKEFKIKRSKTNLLSSMQKKTKYEKIKEKKEILNLKRLELTDNFKYSNSNSNSNINSISNNTNFIFDRQDEDIIKERLNGILMTNNRNIYSSNDTSGTSRLNVK